MADIQDSLSEAMHIDGAIGIALVELETGMCLGTRGGGAFDMELAGASTIGVVREKKKMIDQLDLEERIEDMLVTTENQYHLIRLHQENQNVYSYLLLDKEQSSLPLARSQLKGIEQNMSLDAVE